MGFRIWDGVPRFSAGAARGGKERGLDVGGLELEMGVSGLQD